MKKFMVLTACAAFLAAFSMLSMSCATAQTKKAGSETYYVCNCGPDCMCNSMSDKPGKCTCGKQMVDMHLLKIDGDNAIFCTCGGDCQCRLNPDDPTKCGCGKPVKMVNLKGKYICACGQNCACNTISDSPGKCGCGRELRKVE